ncbi:MAG TPA: hypothetical protein VGQ62_13625 [Chloroflexota bacterium]|nr:hypothetical protein [Chloroflexota bacterium]
MATRLVALVGLVVMAGCASPAAVTPQAVPFAAWPAGSPRRGIDLPPKNPLSQQDYLGLDILRPGAVVIFSAQLGDGDPLRWIGSDPQLQRWLAAHQDVQQIVRMWPVRGPEQPRLLALRIVKLHQRFPWIKWFQVANEPDIEWPRERANWAAIQAWTEEVWYQVDRYRRVEPSASDIKLLFPPLAQGSPLNPEQVGYDALRPAIELYLEHGDGLAGHEYWDRHDFFLVEHYWPTWLQARLPGSPFFVTEAGRRPGAANGPPDAALGDELVTFAAQTQAQVIAPFVLSSPGGSFNQFDFIDSEGHLRPQLIIWGSRGP